MSLHCHVPIGTDYLVIAGPVLCILFVEWVVI
jgi:hypothetical protein